MERLWLVRCATLQKVRAILLNVRTDFVIRYLGAESDLAMNHNKSPSEDVYMTQVEPKRFWDISKLCFVDTKDVRILSSTKWIGKTHFLHISCHTPSKGDAGAGSMVNHSTLL
jgi:hypothetical protein